jgi:hypothetical protein
MERQMALVGVVVDDVARTSSAIVFQRDGERLEDAT